MNKSLLFLVVLLLVLVSANSDNLNRRKNSYYSVRRDYRKCAFPMCGGYWLKAVNTNAEELYVSEFKFDDRLDHLNKSLVLDAPMNELILGGWIKKTNKFNELRVVEATRVVPIKPAAKDPVGYYGLYKDGSKWNLIELNTDKVTKISCWTDRYSEVSHIDRQWLDSKIKHDAIVSGVIAELPDKKEKTLTIEKVYIQLPDPAKPCKELPLAKCAGGHVTVYTRDEDRCLSFDGCIKPGVCTLVLPLCDGNYTLVEFPSRPNACPKPFCDPYYLQ
ncbi:hypothetical protein DLAC_01611 [Tieghemostelium lacteum]|uniref:DUF6748 domain-containing protein n=1 Tax=Tieghemostelium lacteum TaxID=361077 RepID=A0A152A690_TIELA|nr:hypothetical protein DLAC_01611 [Tieghemostelium lacteum]|eukprot:KYR01611.1 hypothetical protein DLAC_01611 [Tieghemostelium lacteum]